MSLVKKRRHALLGIITRIQWLQLKIKGVELLNRGWDAVLLLWNCPAVVTGATANVFFSGNVCGTPVWMWPKLCSIALTGVLNLKMFSSRIITV